MNPTASTSLLSSFQEALSLVWERASPVERQQSASSEAIILVASLIIFRPSYKNNAFPRKIVFLLTAKTSFGSLRFAPYPGKCPPKDVFAAMG
jgi:hypothetical protein